MKSDDINCSICGRLTPSKYQEKHHLIPKCQKGNEFVWVCCSCGDMIHKLFTVKELKKTYSTVASILTHEGAKSWVSWVSNKPNDFSICMKTKKKR